MQTEIITLLRGEEKQKGVGGFLRVHAAPDEPLAIDDAYKAALAILPPAAWHRGREADTPAMKLAADIVEHKGAGQRRNRNRLAFLAADQTALDDIQNVVRKKVAWASIVRDADGPLQLPQAQKNDALKKAGEQAGAAVNAMRRGWRYLLLPQEALPESPNAARGFELEAVALANRGGAPDSLPQAAWKKCEADGLIVSTLGVLDNDLAKSGRRISRMSRCDNCVSGSRSFPTSRSCASRKCWRARLARRSNDWTPNTGSPTDSTKRRTNMSG
ncbi:MAG TPA: hypothetical protein VFE63_09070 [Roseiarcus sp.]|nr:hypothetical protein [Roseiarcus sp.]